MARCRERRQQAERRNERHRPQRRVSGLSCDERHGCSDRREGQLEEERLAEVRLEHRVDRVPAERLRQAESPCDGPLEHDAEDPGEDEADREPGEDPVEAGTQLDGRRAKDERERRGAADDEQDQREVESPRELEERIDLAGRALAEHLRAGAGGIRRLDVEDEGAGDRVRIGRDHSPRDGVGPARELAGRA